MEPEVAPVLALDFGGTQLRSAVVLPDGSVLGRLATRTPRTARDIVAASVTQLAESVSASGVAKPMQLAISAPGPLDPYRGVILTPPNLDRTLWDFPFARAVGEALGVEAVMERDTQVAVLAEGHFGAARGEKDYLYMTVSTGIGGGVVSDGRLLRGPDGLAGELGHLTVDYNGPMCGCGMPGHLEAIASGTGIARRAAEAGMQRANNVAIDARWVADRADAGDADAQKIIDDAHRAFAASVVTVANVFNPSLLVVGGGIAIAQGDRLLDPARDALKQSGYSRQANRLRIVPAQLGDDVGLVGGLSLVGLARFSEN